MKSETDAIQRVRDVRHRISARFGHDPESVIAHYLEIQKRLGDRLLPLKKRDAARRRHHAA